MKSIITRLSFVVICASIGYFIPNIGQFMNLTGALTGTPIIFIFPIFCYLKTFGEKVSTKELWFCYCILTYGIVGGSITFVFALEALINSSY